MITDIHCHFIPDELLPLRRQRREFDVRPGRRAGRAIDLVCRGARYGLNPTFFEPARQIARMDALGIDRTRRVARDARWSTTTSTRNSRSRPRGSATTASRRSSPRIRRASPPGPSCRCRIRRRRRPSFAAACASTASSAATSPPTCAASICRTSGFVRSSRPPKELDVPLFLHPVDPPGQGPHRRLRADGGGRLSVRFHDQHLPHDLQQFPRSLRRPEAGLRAYRRLQPDAAQPHAARGRHQCDALAHAAAPDRRLSARLLFRHRLLRARLSALRRRASYRRRICCSAAMRRSRSASPIR